MTEVEFGKVIITQTLEIDNSFDRPIKFIKDDRDLYTATPCEIVDAAGRLVEEKP